MITICINGEAQTVSSSSTVQEIVESKCGSPVPTGVAVALNLAVLPRSKWTSTTLEEDDNLEILWASSGG